MKPFLLGFAFMSALMVFGVNVSVARKIDDPKLIPIEIDEKWGYINGKGRIVIKPQFDEADRFSEGLARVQIESKSGFINETGKFIIDPIYTFAFSFSEGLAVVGKEMESPWFYIDRRGKTIIEPGSKFIWIGPFQNGLAGFSGNVGGNTADTYDARNGFIDKSGKIVIQPKFRDAENFSDGLAVVAEDKKREDGASAYFNRKAFIDSTGNIVTQFFDRAESFNEGLAAVEIDNLWGFIDKSGNIVIAPQFEFIVRGFSEGIAFVNCDNDKVAAIDKTGKYITGCIFDEAWEFCEGLAPVELNKKFGFIDRTGKSVIKPQFDSAESFYNGLAKVTIRKEDWIYMGFIDRSGRYVFDLRKYKKFEESENIRLE